MAGVIARVSLLASWFAVLLALPGAALGESPAQRLAETYSPVTMLREQQDPPCETSAEQYEPTTVGTMLGNPGVQLLRAVPGKPEELVKRAPTAADVAGLGDQYHLDIPGDPLGDTCVYARDFDRLKREGGAPATVYAHISRQAGRAGLALQYWFFWYFNQFNDLHEGDWEGMQITFENATTARQALAEKPGEMVLFQHAGGERASWEGAKGSGSGSNRSPGWKVSGRPARVSPAARWRGRR